MTISCYMLAPNEFLFYENKSLQVINDQKTAVAASVPIKLF